jgi:hypothetical protein
MVDALLTSPKGSSEPQLNALAGKGALSRDDVLWFLENAI